MTGSTPATTPKREKITLTFCDVFCSAITPGGVLASSDGLPAAFRIAASVEAPIVTPAAPNFTLALILLLTGCSTTVQHL